MKISLLLSAALLLVLPCLRAQGIGGPTSPVPTKINFQGRVAVDNVNFEGSGQFKFALLSVESTIFATFTNVIWTNDGSHLGDPILPPLTGEPDHYLTLPVAGGLYSLMLGDNTLFNNATFPMPPLNPSVISNVDGQPRTNLQLRVWFNDGVHGFQLLTPDQKLTAVVFAFRAAEAASVSNGAITGEKLAFGAVSELNIANGAVTNGKIADFAITTEKINDAAITGIKLDAGSITASNLADGAVTSTKLAASSVLGNHIQNGTITGNKIASGTITADQMAGGAIGESELGFHAVTSTKIGLNQIVNAHIADSTITAAKLHPTVFGTLIADGSITPEKLSPSATFNFAALDFGSSTRQHLRLFAGETFGMGVQIGTLYQRTNDAFAWFKGGTHNNAQLNPGALGSLAMSLDEDVLRISRTTFALDGATLALGANVNSEPMGLVRDGDNTKVVGRYVSLNAQPLGGAQVEVAKATEDGVFKIMQTNGRIETPVLTITGGADVAEPFPTSAGDALEPGEVLIIDEDQPGHLKRSARGYDTRVAGIVSGAGGVKPGLTLRQHDVMEGSTQVALTGRVYVKADCSNGPIKPGDLITTSETPGHAARASDAQRATGAIIGKAMSRLEDGDGLVLVLVSLQ